MRQIILDTETTGLEPTQGHRVIEIGCVELINRKFTGNNFHQYINPERMVDAGALKVHGISNEFLKDKPRFKEILKELINYLEGAELIIHNAAFDVGFLNHEFKLADKRIKKIEKYSTITDSLALARRLHPGQRNSLDALCKRYHIDNSQRDLHGALLDANILAQVYLAMTGGQSSLFGSANESARKSQGNSEQQPQTLKTYDLPLIKASNKEMEKHDLYLQKLREKNNGLCVWD